MMPSPLYLDGVRIESFDEAVRALRLREVVEISAPLVARLRLKPIFGGVFAGGSWRLASTHRVHDGLDRVDFFVVDAETRFIVGYGTTKAEALSAARRMLDTPVGRALIPMFIARLRHERHEAQVAENRRREAEIAEARERARSRMKAVGSIPRRRRAIFERSGGRCHYCACELQLEGRWHIEHKVPRALGGRSVDDNLVAACAPCNLKKRDQTDHEFQARQDGDRT